MSAPAPTPAAAAPAAADAQPSAASSSSAAAPPPAPRKSFYPQNPHNIAPAASGKDTTGAKHIVGTSAAAAPTAPQAQFHATGAGLSSFVVGSTLGASPPAEEGEDEVAPNVYNGISYRSEKMPAGAAICKGYDFGAEPTVNYDALFASFATTGFQSLHLHRAIEEVNKMLKWRGTDEPLPEGETEADQPTDRSKLRCTIFLGYTSNMISCGVREVIKFLVKNKLVSCIVTSAGGVEEDFMKCMSNHYMVTEEGDFALNGKELRVRGLNRIGNLIVPNLNYVSFENWMMPILDAMVAEQEAEVPKGQRRKVWTPSTMIARFGKEINNEDSVYYWAWKNNIPVFCPAITDGSIGDMIYFHSCQNPTPLIVDIAQDICKINELALLADRSGQLIIGGGLIKHHIANANLMRNGADYSVYINTGFEGDGSDAGASPDEAVSWGKIRLEARPVKVWGEASILFPLLVAQTFAKYHHEQKAAAAAAAAAGPASKK